jgi:hypothetical protein
MYYVKRFLEQRIVTPPHSRPPLLAPLARVVKHPFSSRAHHPFIVIKTNAPRSCIATLLRFLRAPSSEEGLSLLRTKR